MLKGADVLHAHVMLEQRVDEWDQTQHGGLSAQRGFDQAGERQGGQRGRGGFEGGVQAGKPGIQGIVEQTEEEGFLGFEVEKGGALGDSGKAGNLFHADGSIIGLGEQTGSRGKDARTAGVFLGWRNGARAGHEHLLIDLWSIVIWTGRLRQGVKSGV